MRVLTQLVTRLGLDPSIGGFDPHSAHNGLMM